MATQPTLASLLGSKDSRKQVSLDLGQQALTPQVRRAGQYTVFAQPTAQENTSTRLANALSGVSPVLKNYAALTYSQGQAEAAAILPGNAETQLKKMEPGTWLNMARQRGLREGLIKKHFNHNLLPEFKAQASEYSENFEKYPTLEKAVEAFDSYRDGRWEQYVGEMPEGIGGSLESKVLWSTITDNVRNGVIESYNRGLDKYNKTLSGAEVQEIWNAGSMQYRADEGVDWVTLVDQTVSKHYEINKGKGILDKETLGDVRTDMVSRVTDLNNQGRHAEAESLIKVLRNYKRGGQSIFRDAATDELMSRVEKTAREAQTTAFDKDMTDDVKQLSDEGTRFMLEANSNSIDVTNNPRLVSYIGNFTNASSEDIQAYLKDLVENGGETHGGAYLKALSYFNNNNSSDEQFDLYSQVFTNLKGSEVRLATQALQTVRGEAANKLSRDYTNDLESGLTTLSPRAYAKDRGFTLTAEQIQDDFQPIYNANQNYLSVQSAEKDNDEAFLDSLRAIGGSTSTAIARDYQNNVDQELKPLYKRLGELRSKDELNAEEQKELSEIPGQLKTIRTNALGNFTDYIERFNEARNQSQAQMDRAIEKAGQLPKKKQIRVGGKNIKLPTVESRRKSRTETFPAYGPGAPLGGRFSEGARDWTDEEYTKDRQLLLQNQSDPDAKKMLTYSLATYPISLARPTNEDEEKRTIEMVDMLSAADFDIYEDGVYIFDTLGEAQEFLFEAANAYGDFKAGQLKRTPYNNALLKFAEMNGIVDTEALKNAVTLNRTKYSQKPD